MGPYGPTAHVFESEADSGGMFKILGKDALYIDIPQTFKSRICLLYTSDAADE